MDYKTMPAEIYKEPKKKRRPVDKVFLVLGILLIVAVIIFSIYMYLQYHIFKNPEPPFKVGDYGSYKVMLGSMEQMDAEYGPTGRDLVLGKYYDKDKNFIPKEFMDIFDFDIYMVPITGKVVGKNIFGKETIRDTYNIYFVDGENTDKAIEKLNVYLKGDLKEGHFTFKTYLLEVLEYDRRNKTHISQFRVKRKASLLIYLARDFDFNEYIDFN